MNKLSHRHYESIYYHPVTRMCYRKKIDGFEFFKEWRAFKGNIWQKSGMKRGFELINKGNNMSIETEIEQAIENTLNDLSIVIALDKDNDLEVTLFLGKKELSQSYVELDKVFLKIEL